MSKRELIKQVRIDIPEANSLSDEDFRLIHISFEPLFWCNLQNMNCIFSPADTVENFTSELAQKLQEKFPNQAPDNIGLTTTLLSCQKIYGRFHDFPDGSTLFVSLSYRHNQWKKELEFYKLS